MLIVWDEPKRLLNVETHGLDFRDAADHFRFQDALIEASYPGEDGRSRYIAIGLLNWAGCHPRVFSARVGGNCSDQPSPGEPKRKGAL